MKKGTLLFLLGLSGISLTLDFLEHHHGGHAHFPGFMLLFGLLGALLLAVFAKLILYRLIGRKQDYYKEKP